MSDKVRVFEIAEEAGSTSLEVIIKARELGINLKTAQETVSFEDAEEITQYMMTGKSSRLKKVVTPKIAKDKEKNNEEVNSDEEIKILKTEKEPEIEPDDIKETVKKVEVKKPVIAKPNIKTLTNESTLNELDSQDNQNKIRSKRKGLVIIKKKKPNMEIGKIEEEVVNNDNKLLILDHFPKIKISIKNLKNISNLEWEVHHEKGIYGIIGENGIGKSSLLTCLAQLTNKETFKQEFSGVGYYDNSKISYSFDNNNFMNWIKNKDTENNWRQDKNDEFIMPRIDGFFESSIINGKRFSKVDNYIRNDLEFRIEDKLTESSEFMINEMNYILYGKKTDLYKFDRLVQITAKRRKIKINNDNSQKEYIIKTYRYYAIQLDETKFLKEYLFSTGEYILLQLLKFLNDFVNKENLKPKLIIIDEIEIALHPLAQERLMERLKLFSEKYNLIVIFATHSFHIIEQIDKKDRFYIYKDDNKNIKIENNVELGYLTSKLYKHQFFDYIFLVEDRMAKKYLKLTLNELKKENSDLLNKDYEIISAGGADKVFEVNRSNDKYKYFGNAKVISIPDQDKKELFQDYPNKKFKKIYIPIDPNIEEYIYNKYLIKDSIFIKKFEDFIDDKYYSDLKNNFYFKFHEQEPKKFIQDICCKIVDETEDIENEKALINIAKKYKESLIEFVYNENKEKKEHKRFKGILNSILKH